ncbi:MAG: hypothetical protein HGGPFJEG_02286 [Ignavibacteria bacterium]|nr:hypothetical protein [Ignavibacteria bacterium]
MKNLILLSLIFIFSFQINEIKSNWIQDQAMQNQNISDLKQNKTFSDDPINMYRSKLQGDEKRRLISEISRNHDEDPLPDAIQQRFFTGYAADDYFGYSVSNAGDVNGDGFDDVIVGAPQNDAAAADAGRAYIFFGGNTINSGVDVILSGAASGDKFGWTVSGAGDLNSDGYDDVIVGAPFNDNGGADAGRAYIYFGGSPMNNVVDVTLTGSNAGDNFGLSVSAAGDVNANGFADVIVGAPGSDAAATNAGRSQIYFGGNPMNNSVDITLNGVSAQDNFGTSVSVAGDINGDGYYDVICGAPNNDAAGSNAGRAYVYLGGNPMNTGIDLTLTGAAAGDIFGYSVSGNGDANGDGYSDVMCGAPTNDAGGSNSGSVYVYFGGASPDNTSDVTLPGFSGEYFGNSVSLQGDLNGDGYSDILAGAPSNSAIFFEGGRTYVYYGGNAIDNLRDAMFLGENSGDNLGYSVSYAGDVNGDGYTDILSGAPYNNAGGAAAGKVYLYLNSMTGTDIADEIFSINSSGLYMGWSVAEAGDVNGDGYKDFIAGAPFDSAGRAYIYFGGNILDNTADLILRGEIPGDGFGWHVNSAGDFNGDGYSDVLIGAPFNDLVGIDRGKAYLFLGGNPMNNVIDLTFFMTAAEQNFGTSGTAGDFNGDGFSDIAIGAPYSTICKVRIYYGSSIPNNVYDVSISENTIDEYFGASLSGNGDVNGDGYNDLLVGASSSTLSKNEQGACYLFLGASSMNSSIDRIFAGVNEESRFGISVSLSGDLNKDGYSDVVIGADWDSASSLTSNPGSVFVYHGSLNVDTTSELILSGYEDASNFGFSVSFEGDLNGDGYPDISVGSYQGGENNFGSVYNYFGGRFMDNIFDVKSTGVQYGEGFGYSLSNGMDLNNDGISDLLVGSPYYDGLVSNTGRVYLHLSSSPPINPRIASARDVPYDQGGVLKLKWVRSGNDYQGGSIINYLIQQSPPPGITGFQWSPVMTVPASHDTYYSQNVNTDNDSMSNNSGLMYYRITAQTSSANEYWRSNILSGYSVDNLAPFAPQALAGTPDNNSVMLTWNDNLEQDFHHYIIYRDSVEIGTSNTSDYDDATVVSGNNYDYQVAAVDIHGNISSYSNIYNVTFSTSGTVTVSVIMQGFYDNSILEMRMSDIVLVELRSAVPPYTVIDSDTGVINASSFTGIFTMASATTGYYYISVHHRNSLETWSADSISYTSGSNTDYEFISSAAQAFGNNEIEVEDNPILFAIYGGDVNQDGLVDGSDALLIDNDAANFNTGYLATDLNGDDVVDGSDALIADNNAANFIAAITP